MTSIFAWSEKYTVKVASLDRQHCNLFSIADRLQEALGTGKANEIVDQVLKQLATLPVG